MLKMMYLKPTLNLLKTSLLIPTRLCFRTGQALRNGENKDEVLKGKFRNLNFFDFHQKDN